MLVVGLPLAVVLGTMIAAALFPQFSIWEAALLAALLAPTDAALGQSVVSAKAVPIRIRQSINIESGLNDGIALPAVLLVGLAGAVATLSSMAFNYHVVGAAGLGCRGHVCCSVYQPWNSSLRRFMEWINAID